MNGEPVIPIYERASITPRELAALRRQLRETLAELDQITTLLGEAHAQRDAVKDELAGAKTEYNNLAHHYGVKMERINNLVGPDYWGIDLIDAVENEFKKRDALKAEVEWLKDQLDRAVLHLITPELEACQAKLAAADDRFFLKIGLEIAKTAYEKSQNERLRAEDEKLREALNDMINLILEHGDHTLRAHANRIKKASVAWEVNQ